MSGGRVLLVEDDARVREWAAEALRSLGHQVDAVAALETARAQVRARPYDVVLSDLMLGSGSGLDLLEEIRDADLPCEVVIMTGHGGVETAVAAIRHGAYDYLTKPLSLERLERVVAHALEKKRLSDALSRRRRAGDARFGEMIGSSDAMRHTFALLERAAASDVEVLLLGESGTGKEVAARAIHEASARRGPFVPVHLGALAHDVVESELFGHERGAFTGAERKRRGLVAAADAGTLFLDEIGTAPERVQVSLLRTLQERTVRAVGSERETKLDLRVIAATNDDLERATEEGRFRRDLFYRLATLVIRIPSLRERREDIPLLAGVLLDRIARKTGRRPRLTPAALDRLVHADWPGNVRQLEHVLERAVLLVDGDVIDERGLALGDDGESVRVPTLEEVEREHIRRVLALCGGNKQRAARLLGIPRGNLYRRIARYGLDEPAPVVPTPPKRPAAPRLPGI